VETYYERNKEKVKKRVKARYLANKDQVLEIGKKWKKANKGKWKTYQDKWLDKNPTYAMCHNAKRRAKLSDLAFDLNWKEIVIPTHCPILGIELNQEGFRDSLASLDRIDPFRGYTKDNVKVISLKANRIKAEGDAEVHERIADYIRNPDKY